MGINPYLLLAGCMAFALVGWGGYRHGVSTADDACAARAADAAHAGLKKPYEMRALRLIPAKPDCEAN